MKIQTQKRKTRNQREINLIPKDNQTNIQKVKIQKKKK